MGGWKKFQSNKLAAEAQAIAGVIPKYIVKRRGRVGLDSTDEEPAAGSYNFYVKDITEVTRGSEELAIALAQPDMKWVGTNKAAYEVLTAAGVKQGSGDGVMMLCPVKGKPETEYFYMGTRVEPHDDVTNFYIFSVDEVWLKSQYHQKAMYSALIAALKRVMPNCHLCQAGNGIIHARGVKPTDEEIKLAALIPGIAKISLPNVENSCMSGELVAMGAGGMPIIAAYKALCLLSGGLDSPVAAYRMMVRGCLVSGVHYLNSTSDTAAVMAKNRKLAARLSEIQGTFTLRFVDINELQTAIVANVRNSNRTLAYKWFMLHLSAILDKENKCIVTGDSLGQVASQTLSNIAALYPGLKKPCLPPLMGLNKRDIIVEAKRIGTYDSSILPGADCCQYMMCKTNASITMDPWTLNGELAKVLRHTRPEFLPVTVDTFSCGKLVKTESEKFPFAAKVHELLEIIDPSGQMGLNTTDRRRIRERSASEEEEAKEGDAEADAESGAKKPLDSAAIAAKYFGNGTVSQEPILYFDAGGSTKMIPEVREAMENAPYGNPSALHGSGRAARMAIEKVRSQVAVLLGVPANDIYFTSGGTEANSIALHGCRIERELWSHSSTKGPTVEGQAAQPQGPIVRVIDLVHHETGSLNLQLKRPAGGRLHIDACQAFGKIDFRDLDLSQVDSITINAHKVNGPAGVGALYLRDRKSVSPLFFGGGQESGVRPGTENVEGIVGFGAAIEACSAFLEEEKAAKSRGVVPVYRQVESYLISELKNLGCEVNRRGETSGYIVHATMPPAVKLTNIEVVTAMSAKYRVEIGTGSACNTHMENTTTYETLGISPIPLKRSIRFSYDRFVTLSEAQRAIRALTTVFQGRK